MILASVAVCMAIVYETRNLFAFFLAIAGACGLGVFVVLQIRERTSGWLVGAEIKDDLRHPAISGHKIRDVGGLILVAASVAALLAGMPTVWYFFAVAVGAGVVIAVVMQRAHEDADTR